MDPFIGWALRNEPGPPRLLAAPDTEPDVPSDDCRAGGCSACETATPRCREADGSAPIVRRRRDRSRQRAAQTARTPQRPGRCLGGADTPGLAAARQRGPRRSPRDREAAWHSDGMSHPARSCAAGRGPSAANDRLRAVRAAPKRAAASARRQLAPSAGGQAASGRDDERTLEGRRRGCGKSYASTTCGTRARVTWRGVRGGDPGPSRRSATSSVAQASR